MNISSALLDLIVSLTTVALIIPSGYDYMINETPREWWKRLTRTGWFIGIICLIQVGGALLKFQSIKKEKKQDSLQNTVDRKNDRIAFVGEVKDALRSQGKQLVIDKVTQTIRIIDTVKAEKLIEPVMDILDDSTRFVGTLPHARIRFSWKTINGGIAYVTGSKLITFYIIDSNISYMDSNVSLDDSVDKLHGSIVSSQEFGVFVPNEPIYQTVYIYFKIFYSDKEVNGKQMPALTRLYKCVIPYHANNISELKIYRSYKLDEYRTAKELLKKNKLW